MTKKIIIPLSSETCHKIKQGIGWGTWITITGLLIFAGVYWVLFGEDVVINMFAIFPFAFAGVSIWAMSVTLRDMNKWIEFKCNCEEEPKGDTHVRDEFI